MIDLKKINISIILITLLTMHATCLFAATHYVGEEEVYNTIQAAVDAADSGDIVIVKDGVYVENINIYNKTLTLKSENGYTNTTIVSEKKGIYVQSSDNMIIDGFTFYGSDYNDGDSFEAALYLWDSDFCIIRNNRFGIDEEHYNRLGIYLYSSYSIVTNNIFVEYTERAIYLRNNYNTIIGNTFIGGEYAIRTVSNYNNIVQNNFLNQQIHPIKSYRDRINYFYTSFEITYQWNDQAKKSNLGNYYSNLAVKDDNSDGIIDAYYDMPYTEPDDKFPLVSPASEYKMQILYLQKDMLMTKRIDSNFSGKVDLNKNESLTWVSETPFDKSVTFSDKDEWSGHLYFDSNPLYYNDDNVKIEIGYSNDGIDFIQFASTTLKKVQKKYSYSTSSYEFPFLFEKQAITFQKGSYLAFKLTNLTNSNNKIKTACVGSYLTLPLSYTRPPNIE